MRLCYSCAADGILSFPVLRILLQVGTDACAGSPDSAGEPGFGVARAAASKLSFKAALQRLVVGKLSSAMACCPTSHSPYLADFGLLLPELGLGRLLEAHFSCYVTLVLVHLLSAGLCQDQALARLRQGRDAGQAAGLGSPKVSCMGRGKGGGVCTRMASQPAGA